MAKTLPKEVVTAIELAIQIAHAKGKIPDLVAIAAIYDTTYESCSRIRRRLVKFERTGIDDRKKAGPKPLKGMDGAQVASFIRKLLDSRPDLDQKGISACLLQEFGVVLGQSTVSRLMKANGIPHKQSNKFYRKTKLVSTNPEGKVMALPLENQDEGRDINEEGDEMHLAASALSQLPGLGLLQSEGESYKSPYAAPTVVQNSGDESASGLRHKFVENGSYIAGYS